MRHADGGDDLVAEGVEQFEVIRVAGYGPTDLEQLPQQIDLLGVLLQRLREQHLRDFLKMATELHGTVFVGRHGAGVAVPLEDGFEGVVAHGAYSGKKACMVIGATRASRPSTSCATCRCSFCVLGSRRCFR